MKNISLLVWLSQLGLSVAAPLAGFILAGFWLRNRFDLGVWVVVLCSLAGVISAAAGFRNSLKAMDHIASDESDKKPPVSFNDHE